MSIQNLKKEINKIISLSCRKLCKVNYYFNSEATFVNWFYKNLEASIRKKNKDLDFQSFFEFNYEGLKYDLVFVINYKEKPLKSSLILVLELKYLFDETWVYFGSNNIERTSLKIKYTTSYEKLSVEKKIKLILEDLESLDKIKSSNNDNNLLCKQITVSNDARLKRECDKLIFLEKCAEVKTLKINSHFGNFLIKELEQNEFNEVLVRLFNKRHNRKLQINDFSLIKELEDHMDSEENFQLQKDTHEIKRFKYNYARDFFELQEELIDLNSYPVRVDHYVLITSIT